MRLLEVALTVAEVDRAAAFYRDVLGFPVVGHARGATVSIGASRLVLSPGDLAGGSHHLAVSVVAAEFELARAWLAERVEPLVVDGSDVVVGPAGWDSRSVYFLGPEGVVLEYIARDADGHLPPGDGRVPRPLWLSEVGIGVADVGQAVRTLTRQLGVPPFPPQGEHFAPVGGHDGLVIVVSEDRVWFPTDGLRVASGPVAVLVASPRTGHVQLRPSGSVSAA